MVVSVHQLITTIYMPITTSYTEIKPSKQVVRPQKTKQSSDGLVQNFKIAKQWDACFVPIRYARSATSLISCCPLRLASLSTYQRTCQNAA